ncbi:hypothetical protein ONZ45_g4724 [Pleurotus djamor]|nr:hypothetical protein ONZ45_g4724 [Pleurotus djamor]
MNMLAHQPPELIRAIIESVDDLASLKSLSLVSRTTNLHVNPVLFNTVFLGDAPKKALPFQLRTFLLKLNEPNSTFGTHVRNIIVNSYASTLKQPDAFQPLEKILIRLTNLESFKFDCLASCSSFSAPCSLLLALLQSHPSPSLRQLSWNHYDCDPKSSLLIQVIERYRGIQQLELPWMMGNLTLHDAAVPDLRVLHCGIEAALAILPGRSVTHLRALLVKDKLTLDPSSMDGFASIEVFSSMGNWDTTFSLIPEMRSLQCLELGCHYIPGMSLFTGFYPS